MQGTILGNIEFDGREVEFDDPNLRNLMAEVSTKVCSPAVMSFMATRNICRQEDILQKCSML